MSVRPTDFFFYLICLPSLSVDYISLTFVCPFCPLVSSSLPLSPAFFALSLSLPCSLAPFLSFSHSRSHYHARSQTPALTTMLVFTKATKVKGQSNTENTSKIRQNSINQMILQGIPPWLLAFRQRDPPAMGLQQVSFGPQNCLPVGECVSWSVPQFWSPKLKKYSPQDFDSEVPESRVVLYRT